MSVWSPVKEAVQCHTRCVLHCNRDLGTTVTMFEQLVTCAWQLQGFSELLNNEIEEADVDDLFEWMECVAHAQQQQRTPGAVQACLQTTPKQDELLAPAAPCAV